MQPVFFASLGWMVSQHLRRSVSSQAVTGKGMHWKLFGITYAWEVFGRPIGWASLDAFEKLGGDYVFPIVV